ncbi:hypothetical protein ACFRMQ_37800 [Kitasatospora sp. NPDC056783]|uniref:hypothetical protein n=1 Tax=Kitasatospora sp. NPDC056783 TaxID=3345943 RepID=UPI0036B29917
MTAHGRENRREDRRECGREPPPERYGYLVTYTVRGESGVRRAEVTVVPGYSQEEDIPRILAARLAGRAPDADGLTVLELRPIRAPTGPGSLFDH